jgi:hypothetical protein
MDVNNMVVRLIFVFLAVSFFLTGRLAGVL